MSETPAIIQIDALSKAYGFVPVLKQLDFSVERGQFVGLLGANGSGKSTLLKMIAGLVKPTHGIIRVGGWHMPKEAQAVRPQIGMVSHKALLYENLTARENLRFFAKLYGIHDEARLEALLDQVGLQRRGDSLVRTFSRGMQQRLSIARALLHQPHILLFDEPYTGLDQDASAVLDTLLQEAHQAGHTILMATHQLQRAAKLANRLVILHRGKVAHDERSEGASQDIVPLYTAITGAP